MVRKIVRNIAALFTGEIVARVCHFISVVYIARLFGAAGFGTINFSLAFLSYFLMVTNLGLGELGVREVSRKREVGDIAGTIISMRLGIALVSYGAIACSVLFLNKTPETVWVLLAYGLTLFPYALSLEWVFRGKERMKYNAYGRALNALLYLGLILCFVRTLRDVVVVALIALVADLTSCLFYYRHFVRKFGPVRLHVDFKKWAALAQVSAQLFISSAMLGIYINFGAIALGFIRDERSVGIFSAASKLIFFVYALSDLFVAASFPVMSRLYHESREKLDEFLRYCVKISVILGLPVAVGGTILGPRIIRLVYGSAYTDSGAIFQILSWFAAINLTSFVLSYSLVAFDRQHLYLKIMCSAAVLNGLLNVTLVPVMSYYAPAMALVITELTVLGMSFAAIRTFAKMPSPALYLRPLGAALVMGVCLFVLAKVNLIVLMVVAPCAYFCALFLFGGAKLRDVIRIKEALV